MSAPVKVDLKQICRAVKSSDEAGQCEPSAAAVQFVVAIAMKSVAIAALGRPVDVDLGNGYSLRCHVVDDITGAGQ